MRVCWCARASARDVQSVVLFVAYCVVINYSDPVLFAVISVFVEYFEVSEFVEVLCNVSDNAPSFASIKTFMGR